jgi:hypothetical protein
MVAVAVEPEDGARRNTLIEPEASSTAVCVVPSPDSASNPTEPVPALVEAAATPDVTLALTLSASVSAALAACGVTTESSPTERADTATSEIRLRSVIVDMYFLSLVRIRNFLKLARRSCDPLIRIPMAYTCNAAKIRKPIWLHCELRIYPEIVAGKGQNGHLPTRSKGAWYLAI